ncbi:MAG: GAF domain-containing protein, partial [Ardenticatenales bacterium]|nr:GAF domain-containing protein [Ardenticatenales bacterium]
SSPPDATAWQMLLEQISDHYTEIERERRRIEQALTLSLHETQAAETKLRRQNGYLAALHETTLALMQRLEVEGLLETIVTRAARLLGTSRGYIYLAEPGGEEIEVKVAIGLSREFKGTRLRPGEGVAGQVWTSGLPLLIHDYQQWEHRPPSFTTPNIRTVVCVPLRTGPQVSGVLGIVYAEPNFALGEEEVRLLNRFAQLASIALDNAYLYTAAQQEVAERARAEEALREAKDAAERANQVKSAFLATISHELRTPLNAIIGYSEMLVELAEEEQWIVAVPMLQRVESAGHHLLQLVNDILDLSKIEAGRMELHLENVDVALLLEHMVATMRPLAEKNGNTITLSCSLLLCRMYVDQMRLRQILLNLLGNAAKFTEQGTITLTVTRSLRDEDEWFNFAVRDTGIGIAPDQQQHLFKEFTQLDSSPTRKHGGTGLGLALCYRLAHLMGGMLSVESELGQGSTFTVHLPTRGRAPDEGGSVIQGD